MIKYTNNSNDLYVTYEADTDDGMILNCPYCQKNFTYYLDDVCPHCKSDITFPSWCDW